MSSIAMFRAVFGAALLLCAFAAQAQIQTTTRPAQLMPATGGTGFGACCTNCPAGGCTGCNAYPGDEKISCGGSLIAADCTMKDNVVSCKKDAATVSPVVRTGSNTLAMPIRKVGAAIDLVCGNRTYTLNTGNNKGGCGVGVNSDIGKCTDQNGNSAQASCAAGCTGSTGSGSCSAK